MHALSPGQPFDAAPFGVAIHAADGTAHGIRWAEPRKIRRVVVEFAATDTPPDPATVHLQYWHRAWNGRPDPILAEAGAGSVGWAQMDDWTNGKWKNADVKLDANGRRWEYTFTPTGTKEYPDVGDRGVAYRKTIQVRLSSDKPIPRPAGFAALTDAVCKPLAVRILFGTPAEPAVVIGDADDAGRLEVFNGAVVGGDATWTLAKGQSRSLDAQILMTDDPVDARYDRTIVTVRSAYRPFSFAADEIARGDRILVDDLGVLVVRGDDPITLEQYRAERKEFPGRTVYQRVFDEPEQTLGRAWNDMPLKRPLYFVHGLPGNRNAMHQDANGTIVIAGHGRWFDLNRSPRDSDRKLWQHGNLVIEVFVADPMKRGGRELLDGYLPILRTWWQDGPIHYEQTTVLDKLDGDLSHIALDDPTVLWMRIRAVNTSKGTRGTASFSLHSHTEQHETLTFKDGRVLADADGTPRLRCTLRTGDRGEVRQDGSAVVWSLALAPGESHDVFVAIPSITLTEPAEIDALHGGDRFDGDVRRIAQYWTELTARGTQIETPEPWINDFYKAHLGHMLINCMKEPKTDFLHAHVGTFGYGVYPNESAMMMSDLDRRGYHREAEQCLDSLLHYQGTVKFLGNYKTTEGLFYGDGGHETGDYNKSHGYAMWNMAEHWRMTRDRAWMEKAAPKLVASCDWVTRERAATMVENEDGTRPIEYGFLPTGSLEDVTDFWHWLATNAATVWGFDALADALADFGHPEAPRLLRDAKAYHDDVMHGLREARILAPVVRLRDGTYVPKWPSKLYERGRAYGWIRETLEGSIFLLYYRLIPPDSPDAKWILEDYEDNLYISDRYGYSIPVFDAFWFSRGGFSMQANLLDGPPPYLYRDEIKHYLRGYFNGFASAFYPEIRMCNEHSLPELGYPAGDHFKTSDEAQSTFWLRLMFIHEQGDDLYLGQAIPRYWLASGQHVAIQRAPSYFGELSFRMTSHVADGRIEVKLSPPTAHPPKTIYLRLRHPDARPIRHVTVNGKAHDAFDAKKEWIVLPGTLTGEQTIVAEYGE